VGLSGNGDCIMTGLVSIIALIIGILFFIGIFFNEESYVFLAEKIFLILFFVTLVIGIIIFVPWLLIIGIVIVGFIYFINKKNNVIDKNNNVNQNNNDTLSLSYNQEPSDFQRQLQENTKTPQQVENENWIKESENIKKVVENDYSTIKHELLKIAQSGKYTIVNEKKCVKIDFLSSYLQECIKRTHSSNPTGKRGTNSYKRNEKVYYTLDKVKQYELYIKIIKEYASCDNIDIKPYFVEIMDTPLEKYKHRVSLPYTYSHDFWTHDHKVKVYLDCSIVY